MLYRPLVWVTKKLWVKIKSEFVALCCCSELRCQVSHVTRHRIPILNHTTRDYSKSNVLSWNIWRHNQSRLQEEEWSSDRLRKVDSRRKSRWWQRRTLRDPGGLWKLLQPYAKTAAILLRAAGPGLGICDVDGKEWISVFLRYPLLKAIRLSPMIKTSAKDSKQLPIRPFYTVAVIKSRCSLQFKPNAYICFSLFITRYCNYSHSWWKFYCIPLPIFKCALFIGVENITNLRGSQLRLRNISHFAINLKGTMPLPTSP